MRLSKSSSCKVWREAEGRKHEVWGEAEGREHEVWGEAEGREHEVWREAEGREHEVWREAEGREHNSHNRRTDMDGDKVTHSHILYIPYNVGTYA